MLAGTVTAVTVTVTFDEWSTASPGAFPHDPEVAPDGAGWYTGQRGNVLGRLDPKTGVAKEFPLPTPNSGPHGLVADAKVRSGTRETQPD